MSDPAFDIAMDTIHRLIDERDELRKELNELYPYTVRDSIESIGDKPIVVAKVTDWIYVNDMLTQSDNRVKELEAENERLQEEREAAQRARCVWCGRRWTADGVHRGHHDECGDCHRENQAARRDRDRYRETLERIRIAVGSHDAGTHGPSFAVNAIRAALSALDGDRVEGPTVGNAVRFGAKAGDAPSDAGPHGAPPAALDGDDNQKD